jgi:hypothetical protein
MNWFWMNMPLAGAFFAAWTGIPLRLVFKHSDAGTAQYVVAMLHQDRASHAAGPEAALSDGRHEHADDAREPARAHN